MKFSDDYLKQAEKVLLKVFKAERPKLLEAFGNVEHTLKEDATVVTELDKSTEEVIRKALIDFDPGVGIEGEELGKEGNDKTFWLVDPIDGTESFIRGLSTPRNIATLMDDGQPVYTIIYKFVTDELFVATKGQGAHRNGEKLQISSRPLSRAWIEYGTKLADPASLRKFLAIRQHVSGYVVMRDFPIIAQGAVEGMISDEGFGGPWDYAPRALLFQEAGAKVSNAGNDNFDYTIKSIMAAAPDNYEKLTKLYREN